MASFKQYIFIICLLFIIDNGTSVDIGSLTESIFDGFRTLVNKVESTVCLHRHRDEFAKCSKITRFSSGIDSRKDYCCALMDFRKCVDGTAKLYCGNDAEQTMKFLLDSVQKGGSKRCDLYNSYFDCIDPIFFLAMFVGIVGFFAWCTSWVFCYLMQAIYNYFK